jgi:hypothetical protein
MLSAANHCGLISSARRAGDRLVPWRVPGHTTSPDSTGCWSSGTSPVNTCTSSSVGSSSNSKSNTARRLRLGTLRVRARARSVKRACEQHRGGRPLRPPRGSLRMPPHVSSHPAKVGKRRGGPHHAALRPRWSPPSQPCHRSHSCAFWARGRRVQTCAMRQHAACSQHAGESCNVPLALAEAALLQPKQHARACHGARFVCGGRGRGRRHPP